MFPFYIEVKILRLIYTYKEKGEDFVMSFIQKCSPKIRSKFKYLAFRILTKPQLLREPHIKHFTIGKYKALYEIRIKSEDKLVRIIFSLYRGSNILLLHAFYKRDQQDSERGLESAYKKYCRLGEEGYAEPASFTALGGAAK